MPEISLSYIIATRNRVSFLKITLEKLIGVLLPDEEIVVVDGNSTDGAKAYLQDLFENGKIHRLISEPDKGQAHAWNKAMLMAKGTIIKKIIDDDVFCYQAIRDCRDHMFANPQIDVLISNDLSSVLKNNPVIQKHSRQLEFEQWCNGKIPSFSFGDVHMLIRRSSLAYIGLYNPSYTMLDWEYALRISFLKANICYYTGYNALSVAHPQSVTSGRNLQIINEQGKRAGIFYQYAGDAAKTSTWSKIKIFIGTYLFKGREPQHMINDMTGIHLIYEGYYNYINELNESAEFKFIAPH